ncbi:MULTISPECIES: PE family protein [Mycobacterium]|uniref:PE family protein n=1 Tax=Mycobacterium gordonae TaxID=1778 RepID=A0A0Q2MKL0_MYCGO|nr:MULTISPECIES: PE family protein [Mycobacterium]KQH80287.1 PE family protein [Mycobacterium gordonae]MDP7731746.1 PE family protein [Mycobacterium sp. TY813]
MSLVYAEPDALAGASGELRSINAAMAAGNAAAATPTTGVIPAASDLVSLLTASQFATHAKLYQDISAQAAAIHDQMAAMLGLNAASYAATEAANAANVG